MKRFFFLCLLLAFAKGAVGAPVFRGPEPCSELIAKVRERLRENYEKMNRPLLNRLSLYLLKHVGGNGFGVEAQPPFQEPLSLESDLSHLPYPRSEIVEVISELTARGGALFLVESPANEMWVTHEGKPYIVLNKDAPREYFAHEFAHFRRHLENSRSLQKIQSLSEAESLYLAFLLNFLPQNAVADEMNSVIAELEQDSLQDITQIAHTDYPWVVGIKRATQLIEHLAEKIGRELHNKELESAYWHLQQLRDQTADKLVEWAKWTRQEIHDYLLTCAAAKVSVETVDREWAFAPDADLSRFLNTIGEIEKVRKAPVSFEHLFGSSYHDPELEAARQFACRRYRSSQQ